MTAAWQIKRPTIYTMTVKKGSPYKEVFNYVLLKRIETGSMRCIWNQKQLSKNKGICAKELTVEPLSLQKVFGAYIVFAMGVFVTLFIFTLEVMSYMASEKKKKHPKDKVKCQCLFKTYDEGLAILTARWGPSSMKDKTAFEKELKDILLKHLPVVFSSKPICDKC